ncbi:hypothetical protein ACJEBH_14030 [Pseudomonas guariconensis]|uniref:hypothetical protein n=1 Tax=Pseudomonas guariconensis TaxID=1288410 RepID=UPI003872A63C
MQLNSARQAWHDALYVPRDSQGAVMQEMGLLGRMIQKTDKQRKAGHQVHQAIAGRIQQAIDTLPAHLKAFGNHMYSPMATPDDAEEAHEAMFRIAYAAGPRMYAKKFEKARLVAQGVLHRYRRMHQGGQSEGIDPCPTPESFRAWLVAELEVELSSVAWSREWEGFIEACFNACNDLDEEALVPVSRVMKVMKEAA